MSDDSEMMFEDDAAYAVGEKVMEMAERLAPIAKITPGARAAWAFEMDGQRFEVELRLASGK
ncbi:hypothetical protein [Sphingomonas hengshuiensis]|uniref:Uncharacterized protein n=1 Tax=Sphingomonas hengshuiensis TaxID=1609977 RepID=A0A7U4JAC4_9SPHN|nr:hypothetical protein [Sphingomonas hengshuiensis]AJP73161.1 hypothetical protein TS85_17225 [Sphingomonas hengshuiensis]